MITEPSIVLENERVLLRPLAADDVEHLLPFALNEPGIWRYSLVSPAGKEGLENYIRGALGDRENGISYPFIVFDKLTGSYAGSTRFYDINEAYRTLQLGFTWYGSAFQGTGLNKNCKYLLLQYAFEELGMERVEFRADANNARSMAAMKGIGCTVEGIFRSHMPAPGGGRRDSAVLSIIRNEWFDTVKSNLEKQL